MGFAFSLEVMRAEKGAAESTNSSKLFHSLH